MVPIDPDGIRVVLFINEYPEGPSTHISGTYPKPET